MKKTLFAILSILCLCFFVACGETTPPAVTDEPTATTQVPVTTQAPVTTAAPIQEEPESPFTVKKLTVGGVETAFLDDHIDVEVIADGKHLPKELLQLIYKIKGTDRICGWIFISLHRRIRW